MHFIDLYVIETIGKS